MVKVSAKDASGNVLASANIVTPVSDEMDCKVCHASTTSLTFAAEAEPAQGWLFDPDPEKDFRRNILRLHDEQHISSSTYRQALNTKGYNADGLLATADAGTAILCAGCHASNALPGTGITGIPPLTQAIHSKHASVAEPSSGKRLDSINDRTSCYLCHPGNKTQCLRGAMGQSKDSSGHDNISCQSCHGNLSAVGSFKRSGWLDEPDCQSCHYDGKRDTNALDANGNLKTVTDQRFATNPDTPATGKSLFRFSTGHGGLQCEACHGSTHAIFPSGKPNDNVYSTQLQGHTGTIAECSTCHNPVPRTVDGGPHGMHAIGGNDWVYSHGNTVEHGGNNILASCAACHGSDFRGSPLSEVKATRQFSVYGGKTFQPKHQVSCYDCHNGPYED
jgi:cytochrome c553